MHQNRIKRIGYLTRLYFSRELNYPLVAPKTVTLTLTARCNLECIMCDHWRSKDNDELTLEQWKKIIDQLKQLKVKEVDISGGEPFMKKEVWEIIRYVSSKGIKINITTNFTLLSKEDIIRLFDFTITRLQISLDGIEGMHDDIRGQGKTFERVINNIEIFKNERKKRRSSIQLNATTVIMKHNLNQLIDLYHFTKKLGFTSITYQPVVDSNLDISRRDALHPLKIPKERIPEMEQIIDQLIAIRKKDYFIGNTVQHLKDIKRYFKNLKLSEVKCYSGFVLGVIAPNGKMWSCMGDFADLKKQSLKEAWFSSVASKKRMLMKNCKDPCLYPCHIETDANNLIEATINVIKRKN